MRRALQDALASAKRVVEELSVKMKEAGTRRLGLERRVLDLDLFKQDSRGIVIDFKVCSIPSFTTSHVWMSTSDPPRPRAHRLDHFAALLQKKRSSLESTILLIHYCLVSLPYLTLSPSLPPVELRVDIKAGTATDIHSTSDRKTKIDARAKIRGYSRNISETVYTAFAGPPAQTLLVR